MPTRATWQHGPDDTGDGAGPPARYISPRELAHRWRCSRTTAQRIARRAGITTVYLGRGRNGLVRYVREEVEAYEESRLAHPGPLSRFPE